MDSIRKKIDPRSNFNFNVGLENIATTRGAPEVGLPKPALLQPSEDQMESVLAKIFNTPTFQDTLLNYLKPHITSRAILSPVLYSQLGPEVKLKLRQLIKLASSKKSKKKLEDADNLLEEESQLRDLLITYLHTLHQA